MIYRFDDFNFDSVKFKPLPRRSGEGQDAKTIYADCVCAFDIECSTIDVDGQPQAYMYVWQFALEDTVIIGRTWGEFKALLYHLRQKLGNMRLKIFDHNLSYEIQFLASIYHFQDYEVFCTDSRKVLKASMYNKFDFCCSYYLTNLSLGALTKRYNVAHQKLSGDEFDYKKIRTPQTELTDRELEYICNDVLGLVESIHVILELNDDSLYTLPLTSTGFVRRNVKHDMQPYHTEMVNVYPPYRVYQLLKAAFRGGNTHANRYYSGEILDNVQSMDISSSYPSQICNKLFPVGVWKECKSTEPRYVTKCMETGFALIMYVGLYNVRLRDEYAPVPYIPISKCSKLVFPTGKEPKTKLHGLCVDNGRVLIAQYLEICITDIDYTIINSMYEYDRIEIFEMYRSKYGQLPLPIRDLSIQYFKRKTELKGIKGQELYYMKDKELLNSIYGLMVQDVVKETINFNDLGYTKSLAKTPQEIYERRQAVAYTQYCYGVWVTSHARKALQSGIDLCGDNLLYCDTDSCKFFGDVDFSKYNDERIAECLQSGAYATDKHGVTHYMGVYEDDGIYHKFITLGAKKYAYIDDDWITIDGVCSTRIHTTVSGVNKKLGAAELATHGGLSAFKEGFIFANSGKTVSTYNDDNTPRFVNVGDDLIKLGRNVVIEDTTYTLSITDDYATLLNVSAQTLNKVHKFWRNLQLQS